MCLCCRSWYFRLVLTVFITSFSSYSFSVPNCKSWSTIPKGSNANSGKNSLKTSCKLTNYGSSNYHLCGDKSKQVNFQVTESDDDGLTISHGFYDPGFFDDGFWQWDEQFFFAKNLNAVYRNALLPSLLKALKNDNCDIANSILDAMQNPNIIKNGDSEFLGFKIGEDKCVVLPDGKSTCKGPSYKIGKNKDGSTRIEIDPNNPEFNKSLDDYAGTKQSENNNNPGKPGDTDNHGSGGKKDDGNGLDNKLGGGDDSTGNTNPSLPGGNNKGNGKDGSGKGDSGNGGGSVGKGEGEDDGDGKGLDDIKPPELKTPDIEKTLRAGKKELDDKVGSGYELSGGQCEPISIPIFNSVQTVDVHCQILDKAGNAVGPVFTLIWTTLGVLIILSA